MKILFTGATGVLGRAAVPLLVDAGHDVNAVSRSDHDRSWLESSGARAVRVDLFDIESIHRAMAGIDTVIHYATAIPSMNAMSKRKSWTLNDRLRAESTALLVDAGIANGVATFVQESVTFTYADGGDRWLVEASPTAPGWEVLDSALTAEAHVDRFRAAGGTGVTLRLSRLYGPGRASRDYVSGVAAREIPIVGRGDNYVSSLHVEDAASALAMAMNAPDGVYNVSDDAPVSSEDYLESLAKLIDGPPPRHIPRFVARLALGKAVTLLTTSQRVSNVKYRDATGWAPAFPSVCEGWRTVVDSTR